MMNKKIVIVELKKLLKRINNIMLIVRMNNDIIIEIKLKT